MNEYRVALAGNPNVGKSTIFNALTGLRSHTGNWTGKTVESADGVFQWKDSSFSVFDLPGAYSLSSFSREENVTRRALTENRYDCVVLVLDAGLLRRNLCFALEVLAVCDKAVVCLNLMDEAARRGVTVDQDRLSEALGVPVVSGCAVKGQGLTSLKKAIDGVCRGYLPCRIVKRLDEDAAGRAELIFRQCVTKSERGGLRRDRAIDNILTSKLTGLPLLALLCAVLFWITAVGANYPSAALSAAFEAIKQRLYQFSDWIELPAFLRGIIIDGVYTTLSWVVAVMLPPMAIFFPLFALMEEAGFLPRVAFDLDRAFAACGAHGKQSLCMMMGLGCNACGVTGCRIIESEKERLIAVLTNNLMPCNGRFPILIALLMMFFAGQGAAAEVRVALLLVAVLIGCVGLTLVFSKLLSKCLRQGSSVGFALELPPYRKPSFAKTILRSLLDRALFVLGRAVVVAAPAGAVIWLCANVHVDDSSILKHCTDALEPFGHFIGLDGTIVMALILGFPANETVIPIMLMSYLSEGSLTEAGGYAALRSLLTQNGWTTTTAVCMLIMTVLRFPCSTTCLTIKKETGSLKWTLLAVLMPTVTGVILCAAVAHLI